MKKWMRYVMLSVLVVLGAFVCTEGVSAASAPAVLSTNTTGWKTVSGYRYYYKAGKMYTGWLKLNGKHYYLRKKADDGGPVGSMVTGWFKPYTKTLYYSSDGVLQLGWQLVDGKYCYFKQTGKVGVIGVMFTGFHKLGKYYYLFDDDGDVHTGWVKYNGKLYYFNPSKKLGVRGRAYTGWHTIKGNRYYFNSSGERLTSQWIDDTYYVDKTGIMLKSCVTPDGYIVNKNGEKVKAASGWIKSGGNYYYYKDRQKLTGWQKISGKWYYMDENGVRQDGWLTLDGVTYYLKNGVRQTGWITISGNDYYFKSNGQMAVNTTVDDRKIGSDGVAEKTTTGEKPSVLLIAGHGDGDSGATATYGGTLFQEYKFTRQLATKVYQKLVASGKVSVEMYDQDYNYYEVNKAYQYNKTKTGPLPDLTDYDYVFEIHFNAAVASSKDLSGDGNYKGVGVYVHLRNDKYKDVTRAKKIVKAVVKATGFAIWGRGDGVFVNSALLNAKTCYNKGVSYGLLETAFIDDKDDIAFYCNNKDKFATGVANGILSALGVS